MYRSKVAPRTVRAQRVNGGHGSEWKKQPDPLAGIKRYLPRAADDPRTAQGAWRRRARCQNKGVDVMFHDRDTASSEKEIHSRIAESKLLCWGDGEKTGECLARQACLDYALEHNEAFGIWGGHTPRERIAIRREMRQAAKTPNVTAQAREAAHAGAVS